MVPRLPVTQTLRFVPPIVQHQLSQGSALVDVIVQRFSVDSAVASDLVVPGLVCLNDASRGDSGELLDQTLAEVQDNRLTKSIKYG